MLHRDTLDFSRGLDSQLELVVAAALFVFHGRRWFDRRVREDETA